jgi:hypothetical protein
MKSWVLATGLGLLGAQMLISGLAALGSKARSNNNANEPARTSDDVLCRTNIVYGSVLIAIAIGMFLLGDKLEDLVRSEMFVFIIVVVTSVVTTIFAGVTTNSTIVNIKDNITDDDSKNLGMGIFVSWAMYIVAAVVILYGLIVSCTGKECDALTDGNGNALDYLSARLKGFKDSLGSLSATAK